MFRKISTRLILFIVLLGGCLAPAGHVTAAAGSQAAGVTAYDLIIAMNTLRVSYGNSALIEDATIDAVAQSTAEIMAASQMSWHIGDVAGRLSSAGYGGGNKVWATENFAVGSGYTIDQIMQVWSDASHMIPAVNSAYCHIGAGVAKAPNGMTYYVLQAAYISGKSCGASTGSSSGGTSGSTTTGGASTGSQLIVPVEIATPDAEGKIFHIVKPGQSFWSIAMAYKITIHDLEVWNNISQSSGLQINQKLFIPGPNTQGYATPTPVGMFQISTPDASGKVVHTVAAYQALSTIAQAYGVDIPSILKLNNIEESWPLQIGQELIISAGETSQPLKAIQLLTPDGDGRYYHSIESGQTLSWIAKLYEITLNELLAWNGLTESSTIWPGQKLLLQITPPATVTPTPAPATVTPTPTLIPTATVTPVITLIQATSSPQPKSASLADVSPWIMLAGIALVAVAGAALARALILRRH